MPFLLIYVTHPSKPEAAKITADLLSKRLIACANYIPVSSVYMWEGFPTNTDEIVTIYKTRPENWEIIKTTIEWLHKYDIPCIMKLPLVDANASYEKWIYDETMPEKNWDTPSTEADNFKTLFPSHNV